MAIPSPFEFGKSVGGNIAGGIRKGAQEAKDVSAIDQILTAANASGDPAAIDNAMSQILQQVSPERQKAALEILQAKNKQIQTQQVQQQKQQQEEQKIQRTQQTELEKEQRTVRTDLRRAQIKSEFESPEVKEYRKNLGLREDIASQLTPALINARQFQGDASRFIPGTRASKALGDLATRAFGFYKPLFGGRLTQREFVQSIKNLSADKTFPGGFEQALNLIESMIKQAELEGDSFSEALKQGESPLEARRQTRQAMKGNVDQIVNILQGRSPDAQQKQAGFAKLPSPADFKEGQKIKDNESGDTFIIEGGVWKKVTK